MCSESWAHKRLFNLPPQFSRLGTRGPASLSYLLLFVWCSVFHLSLGGGLRFSLFFLAFFPIVRMLCTCFFHICTPPLIYYQGPHNDGPQFLAVKHSCLAKSLKLLLSLLCRFVACSARRVANRDRHTDQVP